MSDFTRPPIRGVWPDKICEIIKHRMRPRAAVRHPVFGEEIVASARADDDVVDLRNFLNHVEVPYVLGQEVTMSMKISTMRTKPSNRSIRPPEMKSDMPNLRMPPGIAPDEPHTAHGAHAAQSTQWRGTKVKSDVRPPTQATRRQLSQPEWDLPRSAAKIPMSEKYAREKCYRERSHCANPII